MSGAVGKQCVQSPQMSPQHLNDKTPFRGYVVEDFGGAGRDRTDA